MARTDGANPVTGESARERPILFSAPMVRAILAGRKTMTRRILKPPRGCPTDYVYVPGAFDDPTMVWWQNPTHDRVGFSSKLPHAPGDLLWVREKFSGPYYYDEQGWPPKEWLQTDPIWYWADGNPPDGDWTKPKPSIHMPRWASRITLRVTDVRVERLQDISEEDARAEGLSPTIGEDWWQGYRELVPGQPLLHQTFPGSSPPDWMIDPKPLPRAKWKDRTAAQGFIDLWNSLHGPNAWDINPWVRVESFERITPAVETLEAGNG